MDSASKSLNPNKRLKEEFVSNLNGSSMLEIAALSTIIPVLFLLRHSIRFDRKAENSGKKDDDVIVSKQSWWTYLASLTLDFVVIVVPSVLVLTVLAEWVYIIAIMLMMLIFCIAAKRSFSSISYSGGSVSLRTSISSFRVLVMVVTCLCILAVDFRLFPRRYAKTENYGTSVMDLGVGSFVLANALVSRQARGVSSVNWKALVRSSIPLLVLGFGRLLSTRSVDYQVHVGEYGVHWNFFFTLAAVSMITSIVNIPARYSGFLGLLILLGYQCCLLLGLNVHLLSDERGTDIMSKNKEGIFSIFGYWGIYLVGVQLGYSLFFGSHFPSIIRSSKLATVKVLFLSFMFWLMTVLLDSHVERVSRRTCNLAYVTLVMAQNLQGLGILMLSDYFAGNKISTLEEAINRNLLFTFLLANILTGLVNIYMETLFVSSLTAVLILVLYAYSFCVIPGIADFYGLQLKFW